MRHAQHDPGASLAGLLLLLVLAGPVVVSAADDPTPPAVPIPERPEELLPAPEWLEPSEGDLDVEDGEDGDLEEGEIPDGGVEPDLATEGAAVAPLAPSEVEELLLVAQTDPAALGPLSIGTPDAGLLVNPVPFPEGPYWVVRDPKEAWATQETIDSVVTAIEAVHARYPGSPRLVIGDLSHPGGGRLNRHRSHQAGRDVDIGFYFKRGELASFATARQRDLDLPRTWALVRALVTETDVERIFVDRSLISVLYRHALAEGEDRAWLDDVFGRSGVKGIVQHERRHKDHLHVRFFNPQAQERGRIVYPVLVEAGIAPPPMVKHRVRGGETLGALARRYGTSVSAIKAANGLRSSFLRAGRSYTIPIRRVPKDDGPILVPPRRLPPSAQAETVAAAPDGTAATGSAGAPGLR
jgi:penicillin-insensitive murein endopeptidase